MSLTSKIFIFVAILMTVAGLLVSSMLFETNDAGYVQIKQSAGTGKLSVRTQPGVYPQMFSTIHTYKVSDVYEFTADSPITVRFNDASTAEITGQVKYRLPMTEEKLVDIHTDFRSDNAVRADLVRRSVEAAIRQTASMFGAEDVYSTRRAEFVQLVNEQIKNGIYATEYVEVPRKDEDDNRFIERRVRVKRNEQGLPFISEPSTFKRYGVELVQLVINDPDFDEKTDELIAKRKEAEQEQVVAKAKAERAKQDAITAVEQGKANVAIAEAESLVEKKRAVIKAEKEKEVAQQQAMQAEEEKKAVIARGQAEAEAARLKVAAGLTPQEKAEYDMKTSIGVAEAMASTKFPEIMVFGGGQSSPTNPFDAVGLRAIMSINEQLKSRGDK